MGELARLSWLAALTLTTPVACGPPATPAEAPALRPSTRFARPLEVFRDMGLITGPDDFPAVATLALLAGRGDSTLVLFGLSLPNHALQFQRDGNAFAAGYVVSLGFSRDGRRVRLVDRRETVRVADFAETARTEGTVVFQAAVQLDPGTYAVALRVRDGLSARGFQREETLVVPSFLSGSAPAPRPLAVIRATARADRGELPELVLDPRHTAAHGGPPVRIYVERYDGSYSRLELRTARDSLVWSRALELEGGLATVVELPVESLPLGRLTLTSLADGATSAATPLIVTLSESWLMANFDEVMSILEYIASAEELDEVRQAVGAERRARWDEFWASRDPMPATPANEFRDRFFERIRVAVQQFGAGGRPGWLTDRGEVYIVLGPPSRYNEMSVRAAQPRAGLSDAEEWVYDRLPGGGRLTLVFVDRDGFGTYRMTPASAAAFRAVARRLRMDEARH